MSWLDILDEDNGWEPMGNQVKVSKSGAVCSCHMGRADVGVPLALCRVQAALVTACRGPAASRPFNQSSEQRRSAGRRSHLLLGLDGISRSHVVAGDVAFLSGVDGASLPPVAFTAGPHNQSQRRRQQGIHEITKSNRIELNFLELIDLKLRRCRSTKLQSNQIIKREKENACPVQPHCTMTEWGNE